MRADATRALEIAMPMRCPLCVSRGITMLLQVTEHSTDRSLELAQRGLHLAGGTGSSAAVLFALATLALAYYAAVEDIADAVTAAGCAHALAERTGLAPLYPTLEVAASRMLNAARAHLPQTRFDEAWAHGTITSYHELVPSLLADPFDVDLSAALLPAH